MTDAEKLEIARLSATMHDKRQAVQMFGLMNVAHLGTEEARQRSMQYSVAQAELLNAQAALDAAMHRVSRTPHD